ncbi:hypothetical protein OE88DRAFT_1462738 [Heliocybe sulcata]|uniref:Uncharacterized protein n=1 Tax=Heliocybe sulcata TaxID=5364 RepID=A0A5C3N2V6_9AGAM|nr:hypothetical protein OE88DRAFT_1462738 [Heliocybe sulcata]
MENLAHAARNGFEDEAQARVLEEVRDMRARFPTRLDYGEPDSEPSSATRSTFESAQTATSQGDAHPSRFPSFSSDVIDLDEEQNYSDFEGAEGYEEEEDGEGSAGGDIEDLDAANAASSMRDVDEYPDSDAISTLADNMLGSLGTTPPAVVLASLREQHPSSSSAEAEASSRVDPSTTAAASTVLPFGQAPGDTPSRPEIQFIAKPPFVSDGRGRVVWSNSTRGRSRRD